VVNQEFLESESVSVNKNRIEVVSKIKFIIDNFKVVEKNISKNFVVKSSEEKLYADLDEVKFMQVLTNLVSNAIKFTPDGGEILITIEKNEDTLLMTVADNGVGIPKAVQPHLFEKFTRARRPGIKGEKSVGLGMYIIKRIVDLHEGKIWFTSEENKGTTFYVEIPA
jgi:two-component system sensor histidine kinase VicK